MEDSTLKNGKPEEEERALHCRFWHLRVRGEWFKLTAEIERHIEAEKSAYGQKSRRNPVEDRDMEILRAALHAASSIRTES